jgi:hypothetical protein
LFLGKFNVPTWVAFIVWAEYFTFNALPSNWRLIIPSLPYGALFAALWISTAVFLTNLHLSLFWGLAIGALIWVTALVYIMGTSKSLSEGSLAVFNGMTLFLAVYFTGSIPKITLAESAYGAKWVAFVWTVLVAWFGWFLGWLTIFLTFPKKVEQ